MDVIPCFAAFWETRALPSGVLGPPQFVLHFMFFFPRICFDLSWTSGVGPRSRLGGRQERASAP